jgi:hypothetical protein
MPAKHLNDPTRDEPVLKRKIPERSCVGAEDNQD